MKEVLRSPACARKIGRCPPFQKAAGLQRANRSCLAEGFPPQSQFLTKLLTSTPINFYLRTAEIRIEVLHGLGRFFRLASRRIRRLKLHRDVCVTAVAQFVCEETE